MMLDEIIDSYVKEAEIDYVGLWEIAQSAKEETDSTSDEESRRYALLIAKALMDHNIMPGTLAKAGGFDFWPGEPAQLIGKIAAQWPDKGIPNLGNSDLWFCKK